MSTAAAEICVAHLVRRANPLSALRAFRDSYAEHPAGVAHELLIIFKGFARAASLAPYDELLEGVRHRRLFVRDFGFDVRPYLKVGRTQPHQFFVFLNSFSRILVPGWLEMLARQIRRAGVGIVGATGSHQSVLSDSAIVRKEARTALRYARYIASIRGRFPPFPNPHVRTNAFLVPRHVLLHLHARPVLTKWAAYRFESGAHSLTRQIMAAGLTPLVVGRDGRAYEPMEWAESKTFWIADQENLLVSDNQTRAYAEGGVALRERLAFFAWRRRPDGRPRTDVPPVSDAR